MWLEHIAEIEPYKPGKPISEVERELGIKGAVKLASNENPISPSPKAVQAILEAVKDINRYPDGSGFYLKKKLSQHLGVGEDFIILGNGSNEIINMIGIAFLSDGDEAIFADPSFDIYRIVTRMSNARGVVVPTRSWKHDLSAMAGKITDRTKVIFICNPNNPTGTIVTRDEVEEFMELIPPGILVVFDEAYWEYAPRHLMPDVIKYIMEGRDVIALRTFSKIYGLAGLRIGYGMARPQIIEYLERVRPPFNVSSLAQAAAIAALDDEEHVRRTIEANEEGKRYLYEELRKLGLGYVPTYANFILVDVGRDSKEVADMLLKEGVIVRPMKGKISNYIRVTIGLPHENEAFISAIRKVMSL